jgi:hypothetical protein
MKKIIIISTLLISVGVLASSLFMRVDTTEIYGDFQDTNGIKTYKFNDGKVTCYGQIYKSSTGIISSQSLSCVK